MLSGLRVLLAAAERGDGGVRASLQRSRGSAPRSQQDGNGGGAVQTTPSQQVSDVSQNALGSVWDQIRRPTLQHPCS